jgi:sugar O-acyltransferase (sialic acid O-acetyltransferase NeuD family)
VSPASERLLLVGASGLAREVLAVVREWGSHEVIGFLDDDVERRGSVVDGLPVIGGVEEIKELGDVALVLCVGRGAGRESLAARLTSLGVGDDRYATVIHPSVAVPAGSRVGAGSVLLAGVVLTTAVVIGRHVVVMPHATLTHDDVVEDFATLCAGVALGGDVRVGRGAYLGMSSSVRERVVVGAGATLGMGGVLLADLPDGETWVGVPAAPRRAPGPGEPPR